MSIDYSGAPTVQAPPTPTYVGLDLSLTSTGIATIHGDNITTRAVESKGKKTDDLFARSMRLSSIVTEIAAAAGAADVVAIESPAYGQTTGSHHDRSGLWWLVVDMLNTMTEARIVEVTPQKVKKYATGKGNASKDAVLLSVARRYPHVDIQSNDEADALVLAAMVARMDGMPVEATMPAVNLQALEGVSGV